MKTKKKLFLAIGAFSILVLVAVVAVIAVLAAQSVTVTSSNVTVSYTSLEVKANITASYQIKNGTKTAWKTDDNKDTISFDGTEAEDASKSLDELTIPTGQMTSTNNYIDFIFKFENKGSTTCKVVLTTCPGIGADDTMDNMEAKIHTSITDSYTMPDDASAPSGSADYLTLESNKTGYVIIRYSIIDVASNASLSGLFDWVLEKAQ